MSATGCTKRQPHVPRGESSDLRTSILLFLSAAVLAAGQPACKKAESPEGKAGSRALTIPIWRAQKQTFARHLTLDATFSASRKVLIGPPIPGAITRITKHEGDRIKKGEVLVRVSPKEIYVQTIPLRSQLTAARAQAKAASEVLAKLADPHRRARRLYKEGVISKMKFDEIDIQYATARAKKEAAETTARRLKKELRRAYSKLSDTVLRAPFDGYVIRRLADEGDMARAFPPTIVLVVTKIDPIRVYAEVPETGMAEIQVGRPVTIRADVIPDRVWKGRITSIRPDVDRITRTAKLVVQIPNKDGTLLPGMSGSIRIDLPPVTTLALRRAYLATRPADGKSSVFIVSNGKAMLRPIELGRSMNAEWVEVTKGLAVGDDVAAGSLDDLRDGLAVTKEPLPKEKP